MIMNDEFQKRIDEHLHLVKDAYSSMEEKVKECERFHKEITIPAHGRLTDEQKVQETKLLDDLKQSITQWEEADNELKKLFKIVLNS